MNFKIDPLSFSIDSSVVIMLALLLLAVRIIWRIRKAREEVLKGAPVYARQIRTPKTVAVVDISGPILNDLSSVHPMVRPMVTGGAEVKATLQQLAQNENVSAVILRTDTPGGSVGGSEAIRQGVFMCGASETRPFGLINGSCLSGGVWALGTTLANFADSGAIIGHIGVRGPDMFTFQDVTRIGNVQAKSIDARVFAAGEGKAFGNPFLPPDKVGEEAFQRQLECTYNEFLRVAASRGAFEKMQQDDGEGDMGERHEAAIQAEMERIRALGARIFHREDALKEGLVQGLANMEDLLSEVIAPSVEVDPNQLKVVHVKTFPQGLLPGLPFQMGITKSQTTAGTLSFEQTVAMIRQQPAHILWPGYHTYVDRS